MMILRRRLAIAAAAIWVAGSRAQAQPEGPTELKSGVRVWGVSYRGVIFNAQDAALVRQIPRGDVNDYWTPTGDDVALFEALLPRALEAGMSAPDTLSPTRREQWYLSRVLPDHLDEILRGLAGYGRQYFGIIGSSKRKRLFVNLFVLPPDNNDRWAKRYVSVDDGGIGFWRIQFETASKRFMHFNTNGFG